MSRLRKLKIEAITKANKKILKEQSEETKGTIQIQKFLNKKRITGDDKQPLEEDGLTCNDLSCQTGQAISNYQSSIDVWPADGVWGPDTMDKMSDADKKLYKSLSSWW